MAYRLFIVVVGVDKRSVHNALIYRSRQQYGNPQDWHSDDRNDEMNINPISPSEYLEKIFQIPFHLEEPSPQAVQNMIHGLLKDQAKVEDTVADEPTKQTRENLNIGENVLAYLNTEKIKGSTDPKESPIYKAPDKLKLSANEIDYIKRISALVGTTPRTIKRFINVYRLIRAHEMLTFKEDLRDQTSLIILFLLSLYTGSVNKFGKEFTIYTESTQDKDLNAFLTNKNFEKTRELILADDVLEELLSISISEYAIHLPLVKRFSF